MTIKEVTFERVYSSSSIQRVGQFENERLGAMAIIDEGGDVAAAFAEARAVVEQENQRREEAYQEAERKRREEYQVVQERRRAERETARQKPQTTVDGGELPF